MTVFDLKAAATAAGYRVEYDESAEIRCDDESKDWYVRIPGKDRRNFISVWGSNRLAASTFTKRLQKQLRAIPGARVVQQGDNELRISFDPAHLEAVATILECRKRRQLSPEHRAKLVEAGNRYRKTPALAPPEIR
jgi:hypothetical protein